ncbi:MAG: DMT family transporter [Phycisphaerales bacterium]|nr:MAG: DMT family transporter [Phycisphaerales bacterium]
MFTIIITLLGWASVPLFLKHFSHSIDLWTSNGWRYGFSALLWAPVLIVGAFRGKLPPGLFKAAIIPGLVNSAGQVTFVWGHYKIDPGLLTFGLRSQMLFVAVGAYLLFPAERPIIRSKSYLFGLLLLMCGTAVAVLLGEQRVAGAHAFGIILAVSSGMFFACYGMAVRKFMDGVNSVVAFAAISQYTALAMVVLMLVLGRDFGLEAPRLPGDQFALLLISAVIGIALGHVLYYISIARLGVAVSAGVLQLHPFFVALGSYFIFEEVLLPRQWVGGCIAVSGAILMLSVQRRLSVQQQIDDSEVAIAEGESGS